MTRLLIVDDSALMRRLLRDIFARAGGFDMKSARDGAEALAMIKADRPDVVTLDITMPEMDGLTCLGRIMVEAPCPVVMVSSLTTPGAEAALAALQLGAVDYIGKPEGILSLSMETVRHRLVAKVRAAAGARLRGSFRLAERVRHRAGAGARPPEGRAAPGRGVVVIGSSTGGPRALETVLTALPSGFPLPVLVAQHMPASFTGVFAKRLNQACDLEVVEVGGPMRIEPGRVYIGRGDADLVVTGEMCAPAPPGGALWQPSVDRLVSSCREHFPAAGMIGVLLTGMGNDGAAAMAALRAAGGRTIAEAESTAVVWGMPGELVRRGGAEQVVPLDGIADALVGMVVQHAAH